MQPAQINMQPTLFLSAYYIVEKEMATHSSILAWKISWTEVPGAVVYGVAET